MKKIVAVASVFLLPVAALAQNSTQLFGITDIIKRLLSWLLPIVILLGVIMFAWGVLRYVTSKEDKQRKESAHLMTMSIIGIFVVVSIWGIIGFIGRTFGINQGGNIPTPCVGGINTITGTCL